MGQLDGKRIAILATDGFEQVELTVPQQRLTQEGATVDILSVHPGAIKGWDVKEWGDDVKVDRLVEDADIGEYDALVLPGGVINPDTLRMQEPAVSFVRDFYDTGKPLAAICHGPWMLIEAGVVDGKSATSWPSLKTDMKNAGAQWTDKEVVVDGGLITSRKPDDLPAFVSKIIEEVREGAHARAD
jgi:protease I